jgi:ribonucleoside-diphosphate reductase beta chain
MTQLIQTPLFNKDGDDDLEKQQIINGCPTGISNLNENRFKWSNELYRIMLGNFWIPEKVSMEDDKSTIKELTVDEDEAVKDTLSFLIFLDSFQCLNLPNIQRYITSPNVANLIIIQQFQEAIHSQSYEYILEALYPSFTRNQIYNRWRTNDNLMKRVDFITSFGKKFESNPCLENFKELLIANLILESIYFYQGFMFFDQLASRGKLTGTDKQIEYIRRDEITHIVIFINIIREVFEPSDYNKIYDMFDVAIKHEIEWANYVYGDKILGISPKSSDQYVKYLANDRFVRIGLDAKYGNIKNPYEHLDNMSKQNHFETTVTSYDNSASITGWDSF